jgi:hypothetical protein
MAGNQKIPSDPLSHSYGNHLGHLLKNETQLCRSTAEHHVMKGPLSPHQKYYYVTQNSQIPSLITDYQKLIIDFPMSE